MKSTTQKLILEKLLSSPESFARCIGIISPTYFDPEVRPLVKHIVEYYSKYNNLPTVDYLNAEYGEDIKPVKSSATETKFLCDQIEAFCQQEALYAAIMDSGADVTSGNKANYGKVLERIQNALAISIQKDLGVNMYDEIEKRLTSYTATEVYEPTDIKGLDDALGGGLARQQLTLFSANSGGGKSLMMANIGANYSRQGKNVLQLALELNTQMIVLRNASILTGASTATWKENIPSIAGTINAHAAAGAGSFIVKRIPSGSTTNDIRSYIKLYETEYGYVPDVLIVDYLDLMSPNGGISGKGISEQDKEKSEQLTQLIFDINAIGISASQQNRDGIKTATPDQSIIAGGISKINTVDNYISIYMSPEMRLRGEVFIYYLKTRSSSAVGTMTPLAFNPDNLIMSDTRTVTVNVFASIRKRAQNKNNPTSVTFPGSDGATRVLPDEYADILADYHAEPIVSDIQPIVGTVQEQPIDLSDDVELWEKPKHKFTVVNDGATDELIGLMEAIQGFNSRV